MYSQFHNYFIKNCQFKYLKSDIGLGNKLFNTYYNFISNNYLEIVEKGSWAEKFQCKILDLISLAQIRLYC